jgi:hypothetical protein
MKRELDMLNRRIDTLEKILFEKILPAQYVPIMNQTNNQMINDNQVPSNHVLANNTIDRALESTACLNLNNKRYTII